MSVRGDLPVRRRLGLEYAASLAVAALVAVASAVGLAFRDSTYPTDTLVRTFVPNDVVNVAVLVPCLLGSMWLSRRGRLAGLLCWPGALLSILYTYGVYVLAVPPGGPFLVCLALVGLSGFTLVRLVPAIDGAAVRLRVRGTLPDRACAAVLAGLGALFLLRSIGVIVGAAADGTSVTDPAVATSVADAVVTPAWTIGGILLWRGAPAGYVLAPGLLFQACALFVALLGYLVLQPVLTSATFAVGDVVAIAVMGLVCFVPFALVIRGTASADRSTRV